MILFQNRSSMFGKPSKLFISLGLLLFISCRADEKLNQITNIYKANFWGQETNYPNEYFNELNLDFVLVNITKTEVLFNDSIKLSRNKDSVEGVVSIPNTQYLIEPNVEGIINWRNGVLEIHGQYAALKDSFSAIQGKFEILPDF